MLSLCCNNMLVLLLFLISPPCSSHELLDQDVCFTWNVVNQNLVLNCKVFKQIHEISIAAPFDQNLVICNEDHQYCRGNVNFTKENKQNYTIIGVRTNMKNVEGEWKCRHGSFEKTVNVSFAHGFVHSVDITLYGEIMAINQRKTLKLVCFSCWTPVGKSVEFFVNGRIEDSIRESNGECYHKEQLCSTDKCECSPEGNNFTWVLPTDYTNINVSCEMTFIDKQMSTSSIQQATIFYDGQGIIETWKENYIPNSEGIPKYDDPIESKGDKSSGFIGYICAGSGLLVLIVIVIFCSTRCKKKKKENGDLREDVPLTCITEQCHTCRGFVLYSFCTKCKHFYCHSCAYAHFQNNQTHAICETEHLKAFLTSKVLCTTCKNSYASAVCEYCKNVYCDKCTCPHGQQYSKPLSKNSKEKSPKMYEQCVSTLVPLDPIKIAEGNYEKEIRICGIASLTSFFVIADHFNKILIVFQNEKFIFNVSLGDKEPKAISKLDENNIAVTMPYDNQILFYKIMQSKADNYHTIMLQPESIRRPIGRPYSISYDSYHLAVESDLSDDGVILIIDVNGKITNKITNEKHYGYFTGNTLRLALDWKQKRVYVSALSKKGVSCIDFDGHIKWGAGVPSPRDIITVEQEDKRKLILSSKKMGTLYILDPLSGYCQPLLSGGDLIGPRYLAYSSQRNILYVSQDNTILLYKLMLN